VNKEGKYLINGKIAKRHAVSQLFHSVQLNVNNPHFLIMQGRVTKVSFSASKSKLELLLIIYQVLTMKPVEILSMVEEAAGTKMYENNKNEALKQIEKKEAKLAEINYVMPISFSYDNIINIFLFLVSCCLTKSARLSINFVLSAPVILRLRS
jgi:chromosome segregation ATPase